MPRQTTLSSFQKAMSGEPEASNGQADEPSIADHLVGLNVAAGCTAEMSLSMITGRVREASYSLPAAYAPTENDIVLEAERIWTSFTDNRAGPRVYDVDQQGAVRDWRRPDPGPASDTEPADPTVHTITDETAQQQSLFLVPSDAAFNGRLYRDAPELANLAEKLIGEHGFLAELVNCQIKYFWRRKTGVSKGRVKIGYCKRASDLLGHFTGSDFLIWLSATTARDGKFTDMQVEAALFHQLCHLSSDDEGNWIKVNHDFEGFAAEVRAYGTWTEDLKVGGTAFVAAQQMGLFTEDDVDDDQEEDEVIGEALEHTRLGDNVQEEDQPADPGGDFPDEDV